MKSFVRSTRSGRSRRGHGDKDEVEVSEDEIFDARGLFEGEKPKRLRSMALRTPAGS